MPPGTDNYDFIFQDYPPFWPAIQHNILWLLFLGLIATPLGLLLAVLLDQKIRGSKIYQSIFFTPVMLSLVLIGVIWQLFYSRDNGLLNFLLGTSGTQRPSTGSATRASTSGRPWSPQPGGTPATS